MAETDHDQVSPPSLTSGSSSPRVLVVDDTDQIRLLIRLNLELEGFEVVEASDGARAMQVLHAALDAGEPLPAVVTLDAVMEPVDGWATLTAIRSDPRLAALPVVMITASVQAHHRNRADRVGVQAFVPKPFEPDALVQVIRGLARKSSRRQSGEARARCSQPGG